MATAQTNPGAETDPAVVSRLDAILAQNHAILRQLQRLGTPVDLLDTDGAAAAAGVSTKTLHRMAARGVFTDGRPPGKRCKQSPRRWYADECAVYRTEGEAGVRRLREVQGRD